MICNIGLKPPARPARGVAVALCIAVTSLWMAAAPAARGTADAAKAGGSGTQRATSTWVKTSAGLGNAQVLVLAIDPITPTTLYAGTQASGAFKSIDGGANWSAAGTELSTPGASARVSALAIDPTTPATVYAGTDGGVYKSMDGGAHWSAASAGLTTSAIRSLAVDPLAPTNVYAGTLNGGVFRSTNAGATWTAVNTGITLPASVWGLSFGTTSPSSLWASVRMPADDFVLNTTDGGAHWSSTYPGLDTSRGAVSVTNFLLTKVGLKVLRVASPDGFYPGFAPWPPLPGGVDAGDCLPMNEIVADPALVGNIYAGGGCVLKGTGNGATLSLLTLGLPAHRPVNSIVVTPDGGTLYAAVDSSGIWTYNAGAAPNYGGIWWNAPGGSESGWGVNFAHQGDVIFATWFTYDLTGKPLWLITSATKSADNRYEGGLIQTTGPAFNAVPFDPAQVTGASVGQASLTFTDLNHATFAYTVNGVTQSKTITKQIFGPLPNCNFAAQPDLSLATNYQDMWWAAPAGVESGWGVNLAQQGTTIFATWFTYGADHAPLWLIATATPKAGAANVFEGTLYKTSGPPFNAVPFDPAKVTGAAVGTATFTFTNGNAATFAYTVDTVSQVKNITRQVFREPGTVCR